MRAAPHLGAREHLVLVRQLCFGAEFRDGSPLEHQEVKNDESVTSPRLRCALALAAYFVVQRG